MGAAVYTAIIPAKLAENLTTDQYTATNVTTVISAFAATNQTALDAVFSVWLVPPGGSVSNASRIIPAITIRAGTARELTELVGQVLTSGGKIYTLAGTASAITIIVSGREIS